MCGEQGLIAAGMAYLDGSPPRVRGTGDQRRHGKRGRRITPACAGNSAAGSLPQGLPVDHPRVCGEQSRAPPPVSAFVGSPPRVRGTVFITSFSSLQAGITPACAGNRSIRATSAMMKKDHPRVCGEQNDNPHIRHVVIGSPPRVRGTAGLCDCVAQAWGITPACAGNRLRPSITRPLRADHPRVCGEQTKKSPSFLHSFLSDQENSFSLKYNCSISSQSFCARWTSLQGSSKCFAKVDS